MLVPEGHYDDWIINTEVRPDERWNKQYSGYTGIRLKLNEDVYFRTAKFTVNKNNGEGEIVASLELKQKAEYPYFKFKVLNDTDEWLPSGTTLQSPNTLHTISKDGEIDFRVDYVQSGFNSITITTNNSDMFYDLANNTETDNPSGYCTFKCHQNATIYERTGTIYIRNNNDDLITLEYKQEAQEPYFYFNDEGTESAVTMNDIASSTTCVTITYRTNYPNLYPVCVGNYMRSAVCQDGVLTVTFDANGRATGRQHEARVYTDSYHSFCAGKLTINQDKGDLIFYWTENLYARIEKTVPHINYDDEGGGVYDVYDFPCVCKPGYTWEIKQESYFGNDLRWSWTWEESITSNNFHIKIAGNNFIERKVRYLIYATGPDLNPNGEVVGYLDLIQKHGANGEGNDWKYSWWSIASSPTVGNTSFCSLNVIQENWNSETEEWEPDYNSSENVRGMVKWKIENTNIFRFEGNPDESYDEGEYVFPTAQ